MSKKFERVGETETKRRVGKERKRERGLAAATLVVQAEEGRATK